MVFGQIKIMKLLTNDNTTIVNFVKEIKNLPVYKSWMKNHQDVVLRVIENRILLIKKENLVGENTHLRAIIWCFTSESSNSVFKFEKKMQTLREFPSKSPKPPKTNGFVGLVNAVYVPDGHYWGYDYYLTSLSGAEIRQGDISKKRWDRKKEVKNVPLIEIRGKHYLRIKGHLVESGEGVIVIP